jgi:hypothetical protein
MGCVAELDEKYIRRMEDILAVYEKPLSERGPVACVDEKPVVLHQEVRPPLAMRWDESRGATANTNVAVRPTYSAGWNRRRGSTSPR